MNLKQNFKIQVILRLIINSSIVSKITIINLICTKIKIFIKIRQHRMLSVAKITIYFCKILKIKFQN